MTCFGNEAQIGIRTVKIFPLSRRLPYSREKAIQHSKIIPDRPKNGRCRCLRGVCSEPRVLHGIPYVRCVVHARLCQYKTVDLNIVEDDSGYQTVVGESGNE